MKAEELTKIVTSLVPDSVVSVRESSTPLTFEIRSKDLLTVMTKLQTDDRLYFDMLSCLTGIDGGAESGYMEVLYHLYSIPFNLRLGIAVTVDRQDPTVPSVAGIWRTANWHEREAYDLLGIRFADHPDLRRILLPNDWEGHPLRKDYNSQEYYHGIKVKY